MPCYIWPSCLACTREETKCLQLFHKRKKKNAYNSKTLKVPSLSLFYTEETRPKNLIEKISPFVLVWHRCFVELRCAIFSRKLSDSLDSDGESWILSQLETMIRFIYILDSSNSSSITFWSSQFSSSSRCNWTGIWTGNSNGSWTDKQLSHFNIVKEIFVKTTFISCKNFLKWCLNLVEILLN